MQLKNHAVRFGRWKNMYRFTFFIFCAFLVAYSEAQVDLVKHFSKCRKSDKKFPECVLNGVNSLRKYFITGLPEYGILPLEKSFFEDEKFIRNSPLLQGAKFLGRSINVTETGWQNSIIQNLTIDLDKQTIQFDQKFPYKVMDGWYEFDMDVMGIKHKAKGKGLITLHDYYQTLKITRTVDEDTKESIITVEMRSKGMDRKPTVNLENFFGHHQAMTDNFNHWISNTAWSFNYVLIKPMIDEMTSNGFTKLLTKSFKNFPFEKIFPN